MQSFCLIHRASSGRYVGVLDITRMVEAMRGGDAKTSEELFALLYEELRRMAAAKLAREAPGQTVQATALVHEAWLRLGGSNQPAWANRAHFFAAAGEAMRRILVEDARRKQRLKRGGDFQRVDIESVDLPGSMPDDQLLELDEALDRLAEVDVRAAEVVKLRYFVGLTEVEVARELAISLATVERAWAFAKAWLFREIERARKK
jgi:RNA polymerase sigma factor (TIGR02999 family)